MDSLITMIDATNIAIGMPKPAIGTAATAAGNGCPDVSIAATMMMNTSQSALTAHHSRNRPRLHRAFNVLRRSSIAA
jgi:hypothetical protein